MKLKVFADFVELHFIGDDIESEEDLIYDDNENSSSIINQELDLNESLA